MSELTPLYGRALFLVAHPDDETVGCGILLQRVREPIVVFVTDGAPRDRFFWEKFGSRQAYAAQREREARDALGVAGIHELHYLTSQQSRERIADQDSFRSLSVAFPALLALIERLYPESVVTHAYEGGHPDHDTCSFLAHLVARQRSLPVWDFPLYRRSPDGHFMVQEFAPRDGGGREDVVLEPTPDELERKRRMMAAYGSQQEMIGLFTSQLERFRPQPLYDYAQPPHPGKLNYEAWGWAMTGGEVSQAFTAFEPSRRGAA